MSANKAKASYLLLFIKNVQNRHGFACGLGVNTLHIFRKIQKPAKERWSFATFAHAQMSKFPQ